MVDNYDNQITVRYDDTKLNLKWPIKKEDMIISKRDLNV